MRLLLCIVLALLISCVKDENTTNKELHNTLKHSFTAFKAGDNALAKKLSKEVLTTSLNIANDTLTGKALMNLCRTALRDKDEIEFKKYGDQLTQLANSSNDKRWEMYRAHLYAELARMNGDLDKAVGLYKISLSISDAIGDKENYAVEHFNMAMIELSRGNLEAAQALTLRYYKLIKEIYPEQDDIYGLIPIAKLLLHKNDLVAAAEVAIVARSLFKKNGIVPDPADEGPLKEVEEKYSKELSQKVQDSLIRSAASLSEQSILNKHLQN